MRVEKRGEPETETEGAEKPNDYVIRVFDNPAALDEHQWNALLNEQARQIGQRARAQSTSASAQACMKAGRSNRSSGG